MKITSSKTLLLIFFLGIIFTSCQKEVSFQDSTQSSGGGGTNTSIIGKWNFVGMIADVRTSITAGTGVTEERSISSYAFQSTNNVGTVTIDPAKFKSSGIGYSLDTKIITQMYIGGSFFDSFEMPFQMDMPLSNGETTYKTIGADSLYFDNGFVTLDPSSFGGGGTLPTTPVGSKISWASDTLVLTTKHSESKMQVINGIEAKVSSNVLQIVKLKK